VWLCAVDGGGGGRRGGGGGGGGNGCEVKEWKCGGAKKIALTRLQSVCQVVGSELSDRVRLEVVNGWKEGGGPHGRLMGGTWQLAK